MPIPVGSMVPVDGNLKVLCNKCSPTLYPNIKHTPIFKENIFPYQQSCFICDKEIVEGNLGWPQLFNR